MTDDNNETPRKVRFPSNWDDETRAAVLAWTAQLDSETPFEVRIEGGGEALRDALSAYSELTGRGWRIGPGAET